MKSLPAFAAVWAGLAAASGQRLQTEINGEYSQEARIAGIEGRVRIECSINERGEAHDLRVSQSLGLGLDEAAIQAVAIHPFSQPYGSLPASVLVDFILPLKQSRWHLLSAEFHPPQGASRPIFASAKYSLGAGISVRLRDQGRVVVVMGRQATVKLSFEVNDVGLPVHFSVDKASDDVWGSEAIAVVSQWRFKPGMKDGTPVAVPATVYLSLGLRGLSAGDIDKVRAGVRPDPQAAPGAMHALPESYSEEARKLGVAGDVVIALVVGIDGAPNQLRVIKSLSASSDELALQMLSTMRFPRALMDSKPMEMPISVEVNFYASGRVKFSWH